MQKHIRGLLLAGVPLLAMPHIALAQDRSTHAADAAEDIVVTARRVEERLQDVPISISVFSQNQLANRNVTNSTDLATYTPSLSANVNFGQENATFAVRGFVQSQNTGPSVGVYFADVVALRGPTQGTQAGDGAGPGSFFDLQNVQVLKGPQGTLQGRNTTGGAVLFVPNKPTDKVEGYVEASAGNYDMRRVQAMINLPLGETARLRIAGDRQKRDGYLNNIAGVSPKTFNDIDYAAVRASLVADLTPDLENYIIASYSRSNTNGSVQKLIGCNNTGANATGFTDPAFFAGLGNFLGLLSCGQLRREQAQGAGFYDVQSVFPNPISKLGQWQVINTTTWRASDTLTIKNIISYGEFRNTQRTPLFSTNFQASDLPPLYQAVFFRGVPPIFTVINAEPYTASQNTFTEELQLQGSAKGGRLTYQAGGYFESSQPLNQTGSRSNQILACTDIATLACTDLIGAAFGGSPVGTLNITSGNVTFRDIGLYAQANYALTDKLKLTAGVRYTWDRQTNSSNRYYYNFNTGVPVRNCTDPTQAPSCTQTLKQTSQKPTWLIDLDYKPVEDVLIYAKWARGYRAGGVVANGPAGFQSFEPEKVEAYEGGIKTTFRGAVRGTFNVSGFYNDFTDQQLPLGFNINQAYVDPRTGTIGPAPVAPTVSIVNAGRSRIYGVEVEASISPFEGLTLDAAYTYLNATIRSIRSFGNSPTSDGLFVPAQSSIPPGSPLILSPKNKYSVTGTYTLPLDASVGELSVGATFTHSDRQLVNYLYLTPAAQALYGADFGYIGATNLLNLNLNWRNIGSLPVDLSLFATNVTKEKYYAFIGGLGGLTGAGNEFAALGEPRMYGVRLRYSFGR